MRTIHKMHSLSVILTFIFCSGILADNSCIFEHPTYGVINITSVGFQNGLARFRDFLPGPSSSYMYSFNPCYAFTENNCQNAAICQISNDRQRSFTLAIQQASIWMVQPSSVPVLTYQYGSKTVSVTMSCSSNIQDEFDVVGETTPNHYTMRLRSRCACWNGCVTPKLSTTTPKTTRPGTTPAIYSSACRYHDSRYGKIDLSSIGFTGGIPAFKDVTGTYPNNYVWSYNPCYKFSEDNCQNVAGCQIDTAYHVSSPIGLQEYAYWVNMNTSSSIVPSIIYPFPLGNRRLIVELICDRSISDHRLKVVGETTEGEYRMQLTSRCACWNGCVGSPPNPFQWKIWMIVGIAGAAFAVLFITILTCLFCSKPKRRYPVLLVNEKTPIMRNDIQYRSEKR